MDEKLDASTAQAINEQCNSGDTEGDHCTADNMLCELLNQLGYTKTVAAYRAVDKWFA